MAVASEIKYFIKEDTIDIKTAFRKVPGVVIILLIKRVAEDIGFVQEIIKRILFRAVHKLTYTKMVIDENIKYHAQISKITSVMPVYWDPFGKPELNFIPLIHSTAVKEMLADAKDRHDEVERDRHNQSFVIYDSMVADKFIKRVVATNANMFRSDNFKRLANLVTNGFKRAESSGKFYPNFILVNGEPGLGKSSFCEYYFNEDTKCEVRMIPVTNMIGTSFIDVVNTAFKDRGQKRLLFMIDELDKHTSQFLRTRPGENFRNTVNQYKTDMLTALANISGTRCAAPVTFIICSNNFDTMYSGISDMTHYESFKSRLSEFTMRRCDYEEIGLYLHYMNTLYEDMRIPPEKLDELILVHEKEIDITFRKLEQHCNNYCDFKDILITLESQAPHIPSKYTEIDDLIREAEIASAEAQIANLKASEAVDFMKKFGDLLSEASLTRVRKIAEAI